MRFRGQIQKHGKFWLAEVSAFDAMTQGRTRAEALDMVADWFESMVGRRGFRIEIYPVDSSRFEAGSADTRALISLLLQRQRQRSGLSLADVADRLGVKSRNAYARYERGQSVPTVEKLDELLRAVAPDREILVQLKPLA